MPHFDRERGELTLKLVAWGPEQSGKSSNIRELHRMFAPENRGRLLANRSGVETGAAPFDLLPIHIRTSAGAVLIRFYGVSGRAALQAARRVVLEGVDGVVFVADSQRSRASANVEAYSALRESLRLRGIDPERLPMVLQFNKRDLPDVSSDHEIEACAGRFRQGAPLAVTKAVAIRGEGVLKTFLSIARLTWASLEPRSDGDLGLDADAFRAELAARCGKRANITE